MTKKKLPSAKPPVRRPKFVLPPVIGSTGALAIAPPASAWFKDHQRAANANDTLRVLLAGIGPPDQSEVDAFNAALAFLTRYYRDEIFQSQVT